MKRYFGFWEKDGYKELLSDFSTVYGMGMRAPDISDDDVLFAFYTSHCYGGRAFVLVSKNKELFEVNGYHCSCNGLEDQWELEPTSWASLKMRTDKGYEEVFESCDKEAFQALKLLVDTNMGEA